MVDRLKKEYEGKVEFRPYWDGEGQELAEQFQVQYVPTFVFANSDGSVAERFVGGMTEQQLRQKLDALR